MNHKNIVMIGMPGSGKSTIGKKLAKALGYKFLDVDKYIEQKEGKTLGKIIDEVGDEKFLEIEDARLRELNLEKHVISPGGSAIFCDDAMAHLKKSSIIVFLDAPLDMLRKRLDVSWLSRVVGIKTKSIEEIYESRNPLYKKWADITIKIEGKTNEKIVQEIMDKIK